MIISKSITNLFPDFIYYNLKTAKWIYLANKVVFILLIVSIIFLSIIPFGQILVLGRMIDELSKLSSSSKDQEYSYVLISLIVIYIFTMIFEKLLSTFKNLLYRTLHFSTFKFFNQKFIEKCCELDVASFEDKDRNLLYNKALEVYQNYPQQIKSELSLLLSTLIKVIMSTIVILSFSFNIVLILLLTSIPYILAQLKLGKISWGIWDATTKEKTMYFNIRTYLTYPDSIREISMYNSQSYIKNTLFDLFDKIFYKQITQEKKRIIIEYILGSISQVGIIIFTVSAIFDVVNNKITVGLLTFYITSVYSYSNALSELIRLNINLYECSKYIKDFFMFMDLPKIIKSGNIIANFSRPPKIEFKNVSFKYPETNEYVIKNFSYVFEPGKKYAIVGANGSGKSTLIKLICRFYDVNLGQILINNINIKNYDINSWHNHLGTLFQDFFKFGHLTLRDNVVISNTLHPISESKIYESLKRADAEEFVLKLPNRLDQILTNSAETGIGLSEGQWQKVALARNFYRNMCILILDEPTSAIDPVSEAKIFESIFDYIKEKTVFIISHKFSTIRKADEILVMNEGKLIESGPHNELMKLNGVYANAFKLQAKEYELYT